MRRQFLTVTASMLILPGYYPAPYYDAYPYYGYGYGPTLGFSFGGGRHFHGGGRHHGGGGHFHGGGRGGHGGGRR